MNKHTLLRLASAPYFLIALSALCAQQPASTAQQLLFAGLRTVNQKGQVNGVRTDSAGNVYLLVNQGDGVRLLKTDNNGNSLLAQAFVGAAGDVGAALLADPAGNLYVVGTTTSGSLAATSGAAIPSRTDTSTNSFVAKFDANLNTLFVTFTGGSRIAAAAVAASADAVFVTGLIYSSNLPVTSNGVQQAPAYGSVQNGFVEKFSSSGSTLLYATYLTGGAGDTTPAAIAVDAADNAYIGGETSASGYPTIAALVPAMLSNPSGFLTKITPAGDGFVWSTFVPGAGITGLALDSTGQTLLATGAVAVGQFPVDMVAQVLVPTTYQVLLRLPLGGNAVLSSTLVAPGTQSSVAAGASGGAWIDGVLGAPLLSPAPLAGFGSAFAVHVWAGAAIDQTARFGGLPNGNPSFASLPTSLTSVAVDGSGNAFVAGALQPTASSGVLAAQTFDVPLRNAPTSAFPSTTADAKLSASTCNGSLCSGSAAYLAKLAPIAAAALSFSGGNLPLVVLRNLGTAEVDGLQLSATGSSETNNCPTTLYPGGECDISLGGGTAGTLTASGSGAASATLSFPAFSAAATTISFYPKELDFGVQTSTSPAGTRTITISNLGTTSQTFVSALDATANPKGGTASPFAEASSDCPLGASAGTKLLAAGATCHITIGLTASSAVASDGFLNANWSIGGADVLLTGYSQAPALSVSAAEVDFGTQYSNGIKLPRYLYLSNASTAQVAHAALALPAGSAFTLTDGCPTALAANSVCRIRIDYQAATTTSTDSVTLALDGGLSVLITGKTLPPQTVGGTTVNPNLTVTPGSFTFANAVPVTGVSAATETVTVANTGASTFPLALSLTGDFTDATNCGATLAGGQTCSVVVTFAPSQPGVRQGLLAVTAGSSTSPAYVALTGTGGGILPANNGTLDSGSVAVGQPVTQFFKVSQSFTTLAAVATGPFSVVLVQDTGFGPGQPAASTYTQSVTGSCLGCYLGIRFLPSATGLQTATLTLSSSSAGNPYMLNLTGTGVPTSGLLISPVSAGFGSVPVHSASGLHVFTVTNLVTGGAAVTLSGPAIAGDFSLSSAATGGAACGGTLAYGASCFVQVAFAPAATGTRTGMLSLSGSGASAVATLSGIGTVDPGIGISPLSLSFNNAPGQLATTQTVTITNTGAATVQVGTPTVATSAFQVASGCGSLPSGTACNLTVMFTPGVATAVDTLAIPVISTTGSPVTTTYSVALSGAYTSSTAGLQILPEATQFGPLAVGQQSAARIFTINNLSAKSLTLAVAMPRQFLLTSPPCAGLAPGASCSFSAAFLPLTNGDTPGTLYAQATPADGSAALTGLAYVEGYGAGAGALTITGGLIVSGGFNFGLVQSGQTATQVFTLSNKNAAGTITVRRVTSAPPFLATTTCGNTLAAGQSCTVTVSYTPSNQVANGTVQPANSQDAGSLVIESDAVSGPDLVNLSGTGTPLAVGSPVNTTPLATFTLSSGSLTFASTSVGNASAVQTLTLNNTGTATIHVSQVFATPDFAVQNGCATLIAGASCSIGVSATPQTTGQKIASLEIASDAAVPLEYVSLLTSGMAAALTISPATLNFGSVQVGSTATLPVQVTDSSANPVVFTGVSATGDYSAGGSCPAVGASLPGSSTCTVQVTFKPGAAGTRAGTLSVATSATTNPLTVALTGIGLQSTLGINPSSLAFGSLVVGVGGNLSLTLTNSGTAPVTGLVLTATGDFAVTIPCSATSLAPGTGCTVQVTFTPVAVGTRTGTLTVTSSDPHSPVVVPLTGTGVQAGGFTLSVAAGTTASVSVVSGQPASYNLTVSPVGGFAGTVALTCTPVIAAQYASCSLLPGSVSLAGGTETAVATINTITSTGGSTAQVSGPVSTAFLCLLLPGIWTVWRGRRSLRHRRKLLLAMLFASFALFSSGCGGSSNYTVRYTPTGTYQYLVTGSSTSGVAATQTVTLNLTVTAR